ncbi:cob(I)yrinic acid a,c-diamide adenosyltransferase [Candidatus Berkelbacteria bacterium]|nr:cob(I)yrinic acid a,c-diamide adenosyltransferase [Candidatus Berkelbacteria bacterium]
MSRLYTRTGDAGETSLLGGVRLSKNDHRFELIGSLDELNAHIGAARAQLRDVRPASPAGGRKTQDARDIDEALDLIQRDLFVIGAYLAEPVLPETGPITAERIAALEQQIDRWDSEAGQLVAFILPGGTIGAAHLHVARAVCRRSERALTTLATTLEVAPTVCTYVNRLSDALFAAARVVNARAGVPESTWSGKDAL